MGLAPSNLECKSLFPHNLFEHLAVATVVNFLSECPLNLSVAGCACDPPAVASGAAASIDAAAFLLRCGRADVLPGV